MVFKIQGVYKTMKEEANVKEEREEKSAHDIDLKVSVYNLYHV